MANLDTTEVHSRTFTAFFDTRSAADQAVSDLEAAGIPRQQIRRVDGSSSAITAETGSDTGFWASLKDMFMPDEDRYGYAEGLRRGGYIVAVTADEANYTRVLDIIDRDGSVDMDEREASWRKEGWKGYQAASPVVLGATAAPAVTSSATQTRVAEDRVGSVVPVRSTIDKGAKDAAAAGTIAAGGDEVVPVYEEQLRVGKRDVSHGRVRLRSYVVETPVSEQIGLREERVSVERKPVDRAVTGLSGDVFKERVIEVEETAEEAIVSKDVRLKEEITLRKEADERTETVSDSVRRTEVEVEDNRGYTAVGAAAPAMSASTSFATMIAEHMDVIASDGSKVGIVDHLEGADRIKLTKTASPDGQHHFIPLSWVDHVDQHVHLNRAAEAVRAGW